MEAKTELLPLPYGEILVTAEQLTQRIDEIAAEVIERWQDTNPLFICLLRGGAPFSARLMGSIAVQDEHFHPELDYMMIRTYGDEREAAEPQVVLELAPSTVVADRSVIVLDDVLDSGISGEYVQNLLLERGARDVNLVYQTAKDRDRPFAPNVAIVGFTLPDVWLTGTGLDDARVKKEANRWSGFIATAATLDPEV